MPRKGVHDLSRVGEGPFQPVVQRVPHDAFDVAHRARGVVGDHLRQLPRLGHELRRGQHLGDDAEFFRLLRVDLLLVPHQQHPHERLKGDPPAPRQRRVDRELSDGYPWVEEVGVLRGDGDVGVGDEGQPNAAHEAVHRGYQRLAETGLAGTQRPAAGTPLSLGRRAFRLLLDVEPRAEGTVARPRQDHGADVFVGVELAPDRRNEFAEETAVESVQPVGTVERNGGDAVALFDQDLVRHVSRSPGASASPAAGQRRLTYRSPVSYVNPLRQRPTPCFGAMYTDAMRVLALDVGERRIGAAISDPLGVIATPLTVVERVGGVRDYERLIALAQEHEAERILVGMPVSMDGAARMQARAVQRFVDDLTERSPLPVETLDERLTTVEAERRMMEAGASASKRRAERDAAAAAVLLQAYLESRRR